MISCLRRLSLRACVATLGSVALGSVTLGSVTLGVAAPAVAVPLVGIEASGGAYLGFTSMGNNPRFPSGSMSLALEAAGSAFGLLDASGRYMSNMGTSANLIELALRKEVSPLPMLSIKPSIGYQTQNVFTTGMDHAPQGKVYAAFSPFLLPAWAEAETSIAYPLALGRPVVGTMFGAYFAPLPVMSIGVRYLDYRDLSAQTAPVDFGGLQIGLRATI